MYQLVEIIKSPESKDLMDLHDEMKARVSGFCICRRFCCYNIYALGVNILLCTSYIYQPQQIKSVVIICSQMH